MELTLELAVLRNRRRQFIVLQLIIVVLAASRSLHLCGALYALAFISGDPVARGRLSVRNSSASCAH